MAVAEKVVPAMYGLMLYRLESASVKPHTLQLGRLEMCAWLCCQPGRASGCGHAPSEEFKDGFLAVLVVLAEGKLGVDAIVGKPQRCHGTNRARTSQTRATSPRKFGRRRPGLCGGRPPC